MPALLGMSALGFSGFSLLLPVGPLWVVQGGSSESGAGMVNAVLMLTTVLTQTTVPNALLRFGWRAVLATGMLLLGLPSVLFILSDNLWWVLALSAIRGGGFAVLTVCGSGAVAALFDAPRHGRAVGVYGLGIAVPQFFFVPSAALLAEQFSFSLVFVLGGLPVLAVPVVLRLGARLDALPGDTEDSVETSPARTKVILALVMPSVILLAVTTPGGALLSFAPQFAPSAFTALVGLLGLTAAAALSRWLVGSYADKYGAKVFIPPLLVLCAIGLALCAWAVLDNGPRPVVLVIGMTIVGLTYGSLQNLTLVAAFAAVHKRDHNTASAVWNIGFDAGTGLGSLVVGMIAAGISFSVALLTPGILCLVVAAATLAWRAPRAVTRG